MRKKKNLRIGAAILIVVISVLALGLVRPSIPTEKIVVQKDQFASNWIVSEVQDVTGGPTTAKGYREGSEINATTNNTRTLMRNWVYAFSSEARVEEWFSRNVNNLRASSDYEEMDVTNVTATCYGRYQRLQFADRAEIACYKNRVGFEVEVVSRDVNSKEFATFFARRVAANINAFV